METALLATVVVAGAAACPLMAWVQRRRGRAGCCPPARPSREGRQGLAVLEAERARVRERIRALEQAARGAGGG